jgi:hypothetical protein
LGTAFSSSLKTSLPAGRILTLVLAALAVIGINGCEHPQGTSPTEHNASASTKLDTLPPAARDLSQDDAEGGHTLRKHVGKSDSDLKQRLAREHSISAASTYTDRETAERVVGTTLNQQRDKIQRWLELGGEHPNLVLDYAGDQPIGRTMRRGAATSTPCAKAVVVLRYAGGGQYYVLTSYPECRG